MHSKNVTKMAKSAVQLPTILHSNVLHQSQKVHLCGKILYKKNNLLEK